MQTRTPRPPSQASSLFQSAFHTHFTGKQTTAFREEARAIIKRALGGGPDDVVLLIGSGTTAAVSRLVHYLGLQSSVRPQTSRETFNPARHTNPSYAQQQPRAADLGAAHANQETPEAVVFVGPHEHHSNLLPWHQSTALVVQIGEDATGRYAL